MATTGRLSASSGRSALTAKARAATQASGSTNGLKALSRASEVGLIIHRGIYQPSSEHPWGLVEMDLSRTRYLDLAPVRQALMDFLANRRSAFAAINGAVAAGEVRRAPHEQRLQADATRVGALILVPSLIAAVYGANVGLPYRDSLLGLVLLFALCGSAALVTLGVVRARYPAPADEREGRARWGFREVLSGPSGMPLLLGAGLAVTAIVLVALAITNHEILPRSDDPVVQRLDQLIRELRTR